MIDFLEQIDKHWLLALNNDYSDFWDYFMYSFSGKTTWIPLYLSIIFVVIQQWKKSAWIVILGLVLSIVIADQVASGILKELIARPRPTHDPEIAHQVVTVFGYTGGMFGFASSHAANSFALALLTALIFKNRVYIFPIFLWAIANSYSRIYLGVHYVGDILAGMLIGFISALIIFGLFKTLKKHLLLPQKKIENKIALIPGAVILLTIVALLLLAGIKS